MLPPRYKQSIYPWVKQPWKYLLELNAQEKLPHTLLFHGVAGVAKIETAYLFAQYLHCNHPADTQVCGHCQSCHWFANGQHPDLIVVEPPAVGKHIGIEQIRELIYFLQLKSHTGGYKIVVINGADKILFAAANSMLKILEEPPDQSLLFLVAEQAGKLLPTIRSRCQSVHFTVNHHNVIKSWIAEEFAANEKESDHSVDTETIDEALAVSDYSPFRALAMLQQKELTLRDQCLDQIIGVFEGRMEPLKIAKQWYGGDLASILQWLSGMLLDMLRVNQNPNPPALCHPKWHERFAQLADMIDDRHLHDLLKKVMHAESISSSSVNKQLLLEELFIQFSEYGIKT